MNEEKDTCYDCEYCEIDETTNESVCRYFGIIRDLDAEICSHYSEE